MRFVRSCWFDGAVGVGDLELACVFTDARRRLDAASVVTVTARLPEDALYDRLTAMPAALDEAGIRSVSRIGDCLAPGAIVHAVFSGHRYARELDAAPDEYAPFKYEPVRLESVVNTG